MMRPNALVAAMSLAFPVLAADPVVAFADKDPVLSSRSSIATLPLTVSQGEASVLLKTASIRTHDGIAIAPEAISFPATYTRLIPGRTAAITVDADPVRLSRQGSYPVTVDVTDVAGKPLSPHQLTFRYVVPDVTLQVENGGMLIWTVRRPYPWAVASEQREYTLWSVPSDSSLADMRGLEASLSIGGATGIETPGGAKISPIEIDKQSRKLVARISVPPGARELFGALRISGPGLKQEVTQPVIVRVKDWWLFPLLAIAAGYVLSFLATKWAAQGQQETFNLIRKQQIHQAIRDLADRRRSPAAPDFAQVEGLLHQADLAAISGDVGKTKVLLQDASTALDLLRSTPSAQAPGIFSVNRSPLANFWLAALGAILTLLAAFLVIWQSESFSGLGNYVAAFLGGFGIDQSIQGLAPILQRRRGAAKC